MALDSLNLAVAANHHFASGPHDLCRRGCQLWKNLLFFTKPWTALGLSVQHTVRKESLQLRVIMHFRRFVEIILRPRPAIGHQQCGSVSDPGLDEGVNHIGIKWDDGKSVFVTAHPVNCVGKIEFQVQSAFGSRHQLIFLAGLDHPFALLAIAHRVRFHGVRPVVLLVARNHGQRVLIRLKIVAGEDARTSGIGARPQNVAGVDQVLIGEHVVGAGLRIAAGGNSVGQVRQ